MSIAPREFDPVEKYASLKKLKALRQVLVAEYRCRSKGCLLLHIWQSPRGRYWYMPPYRLSPEITAVATVESARLKRTSDGYQKWIARAGSLDVLLEDYADFLDTTGRDIACDHVRGMITFRRLAADIDGVTPGAPVKLFAPDDDTPGIILFDGSNRPVV